METFGDLRTWALQEKAEGGTPIYARLSDFHVQIYANAPLQFTVSKSMMDAPFIKFTEQRADVFKVAVAHENDPSIHYTESREFRMTDWLSDLKTAFPDGAYMDFFLAALLD